MQPGRDFHFYLILLIASDVQRKATAADLAVPTFKKVGQPPVKCKGALRRA
jgi:hypothetical protein